MEPDLNTYQNPEKKKDYDGYQSGSNNVPVLSFRGTEPKEIKQNSIHGNVHR